MKITFVLPSNSNSGGMRVIGTYARELRARGHDVFLVSKAFKKTRKRSAMRNLLTKGTLHPKRKRGPFLEPLADVHKVLTHQGTITDADVPDADIVVATWWMTAFEVAAMSPSKGAKVYFVQHHEVHGHLPSHLSRGSYYLPLRKITISSWLAEIMAREYNDHDVDLVLNAVDAELFNAPPRQKNETLTVGLMYAPNYFKGTDVSIAAIRQAQQRYPDLKVMAFGKGMVRPDLPLPDNARYYHDPSQEEIREIYSKCDIWLMGSRAEGFGLPILEAMACRTPVISTRTGAALDVIENGRTGWVVEVEDQAAMTAAIEQAAAMDAATWRSMSEAAHASATTYSWKDAADRFEEALLNEFRRRSDDENVALPSSPGPI